MKGSKNWEPFIPCIIMFTLQCICNGIVYEQLEKDGPTTDVLEMFFFRYVQYCRPSVLPKPAGEFITLFQS